MSFDRPNFGVERRAGGSARCRAFGVSSILATLWILAALAGCQGRDPDRLVIATTWSDAECLSLEADFHRRQASRTGKANKAPAPLPGIRWIRLSPGDDLARFVRNRRGVDLLLGGSAPFYRSIEPLGLLAPIEADGKAQWLSIDLSEQSSIVQGREDDHLDARFLERARADLSRGSWAEGYARLVQGAELPGKVESPSKESEGVGLLPEGDHRSLANEFLAFLVEQREAKPEAPREGTNPVADGLLADLLRATLIDSREELDAARLALQAPGDHGRSSRWMTEPPPWPPASVAKILAGDGDRAMTLIETLAGQIAPEERLRSWLLRSWLTPTRPIDGAFLDELSKAEDGRLAREPRFRSWLRAEWTAWARQRYRRVARLARAGMPVPEAGSSPPTTPETKGTDAR